GIHRAAGAGWSVRDGGRREGSAGQFLPRNPDPSRRGECESAHPDGDHHHAAHRRLRGRQRGSGDLQDPDLHIRLRMTQPRGGGMEPNMKRESGFTLIELMVSMAVLLVVVGATLSLFQYAMRTNESSTQLSNMNGNLRSAMNLITRDLIQAGQGIPTGGVPLPVGVGCVAVNRPVPVGTATYTYGCPNSAS